MIIINANLLGLYADTLFIYFIEKYEFIELDVTFAVFLIHVHFLSNSSKTN